MVIIDKENKIIKISNKTTLKELSESLNDVAKYRFEEWEFIFEPLNKKYTSTTTEPNFPIDF